MSIRAGFGPLFFWAALLQRKRPKYIRSSDAPEQNASKKVPAAKHISAATIEFTLTSFPNDQ
jgi:hypothetical protein